MSESVIVIPYDPNWPVRFERESALLKVIFSETETIVEHVGSTAVPGLGAKPVIDIMVGVSELSEVERRIPELEAQGYEYVPKYETQLPERRYFRKPRLGSRAFHVHCVVRGSQFWVRHIAFRDYLRVHPESAAAYFELKQALASACTKEAYTEAKSPFVERILHRAFEELASRTAQQRVAADGR